MTTYKGLSVAKLETLLTYEPATGKLFWKRREGVRSGWNTRYANKEAFTASCVMGYLRGSIDSIPFLAHKVAWALFYGTWPELDLDHINKNKGDNRIENLREVTKSQNQWNRVAAKKNVTGYKGVSYYPRDNNWKAQIRVKKKHENIGFFPSAREAALAYDNRARELHGAFAVLNFPEVTT